MRPEEALDAARALAREHEATTVPAGGLEVERADQPSDDQLVQWAVIEPDLREVRSTRPGPIGAGITALKQGQLRLMGQYHAQVTSVQNRVNVHLSLRSTLMRDELRVLRLELAQMRARVAELESRAGIEPPPEDDGDAVEAADEETGPPTSPAAGTTALHPPSAGGTAPR